MNLTYSQALDHLKNNVKMQRSGWNGKGMYLIYFSPVANGQEQLNIEGDQKLPLLPFIVMKTADNMFVPWLASQTDILADDWQTYQSLDNHFQSVV